MKEILFVNACMRGQDLSRTWRISQAFFQACKERWPDAVITERNLTGCDLPVLSGPMTDERDRRFQTDPHAPMFQPAWEMSRADLVVVAAPYWDLAFPAALKIYLEWASVLGITFHYTEQGAQEGLCKAGDLVYITTSGGPIGDSNFGFQYLQGLGKMFGIPRAHCLTVEGLDVWGADTDALMAQGAQRAQELAATL